MREQKRVLIIEDDEEIAMLEQDYLELHDMSCDWTRDGEDAMHRIQKGEYDLVLLDLMLPGKSGFVICEKIRSITDIPILIVTARGDSVDKVRGLGLGADDYIAKPFDPAELVARVKAHLSRYSRLTSSKPLGQEEELRFGNICIHPKNHKVWKDGKEIRFPNKELELLTFLARHPNEVFSKEYLFERIWGYAYVGDSATVTVHVGRIRDKIEENPQEPKIIETVWGAGYRLNA